MDLGWEEKDIHLEHPIEPTNQEESAEESTEDNDYFDAYQPSINHPVELR